MSPYPTPTLASQVASDKWLKSLVQIVPSGSPSEREITLFCASFAPAIRPPPGLSWARNWVYRAAAVMRLPAPQGNGSAEGTPGRFARIAAPRASRRRPG